MGWLILALAVLALLLLVRYAGRGEPRSSATDHSRSHGEAGGHQHGHQHMGPF